MAYSSPGLRRVRLLIWQLFNRTPLAQPIDGQAEQAAASAVKMDWATFQRLRGEHPDMWAKAAKKRALAVANGYFPPQPPQLARYRQVTAWKKKASSRKLLRRNRLTSSSICVSSGRARNTTTGNQAPGRQIRCNSLGIPPREPAPKLWPTVDELAARLTGQTGCPGRWGLNVAAVEPCRPVDIAGLPLDPGPI